MIIGCGRFLHKGGDLKLIDDRELYILSLKPLVYRFAKFFVKRLPEAIQETSFDDFVQAGWIGAIKAVDQHDPTKSVLDRYAVWRIKGEILDHMRDCDMLSKDYRSNIKKGKEAEVRIFSIDYELEDGNRVGDSIEDKRAIKAFGSINASIDCLTILRRAELSERYRKVLFEYYWNDKTMKEIGKVLHVNESRACQIHRTSIEKMRGVV